MSHFGISVVLTVCICVSPVRCEAQTGDGPFRQGVAKIFEQKLLAEFADKPTRLVTAGLFEGEMRFATEQIKDAKFEFKTFTLTNDKIETALSIQMPIKISGKITNGERTKDIAAIFLVSGACSATVSLKVEGENVKLVPTVKDLTLLAKLSEVKPDGVLRDKANFQKFVNANIASRQKEILRVAQKALLESATLSVPVHGQPSNGQNALLRILIEDVLVQELSKHQSQDTAWYSKDEHRIKIGPIRSKVKTETWTWLDNPTHKFNVSITKLELKEGRISFSAKAIGAIACRFKGDWKIARASVSGTAKAEIVITGEAGIGANGTIQDAKITELNGKLTKVDVQNCPPVLDSFVADIANGFLVENKEKFRDEVVEAFNGVSF